MSFVIICLRPLGGGKDAAIPIVVGPNEDGSDRPDSECMAQFESRAEALAAAKDTMICKAFGFVIVDLDEQE